MAAATRRSWRNRSATAAMSSALRQNDCWTSNSDILVGRFSAPMKRLAKDTVTPFGQSKPPIYLGRAKRESLPSQAHHRAGSGLASGHRVNSLERYDYPSSGTDVPFERWELGAGLLSDDADAGDKDLSWFEHVDKPLVRPPLKVSPSSLTGATARILETVPIGRRIDTGAADDRSRLGEAIHACIAADLATPAKSLDMSEVASILKRMQAADNVDAAALHHQLGALRLWLSTRWPDAIPVVEVPVARATPGGQHVQGRTDLVLRTATGWILMDHKSTPQGRDQWGDLATTYAGQLAAYRDVLQAASGLPVEEMWFILPVAGAALWVEVS